MNRERFVRTPDKEKNVLRLEESNPNTSIRAVAKRLGFGEHLCYTNTCNSKPFLYKCLWAVLSKTVCLSLPSGLCCRKKLIFVQQVLPELFKEAHVPYSVCRSKKSSMSEHYAKEVKECLNIPFGHHWMSRCGPIHRPARTSNLLCLHFCWVYMKSLVYEIPIDSVEHLVFSILVIARGI
ncbi:hypothetical protein NPIL_103661 [Nephila pilipes]|uniref:Uncharacterized protein n=1 Tax=Nephila pilipes TaxID=299642 RepID=A0A8X6UAG1_NEPPI|nr:hypothetical protein NPIL_103661 [Nephila pilipes]